MQTLLLILALSPAQTAPREKPPVAPPVAERPPVAPPVEKPQVPPQKPQIDQSGGYSAVYARVRAGERLVVAVRTAGPPGSIRADDFPAEPGVYDCFLHNDSPSFQLRAAPGVVAAPTFPARNPTHRCDKCGHESPAGIGTWVVRGYGRDGSHSHQCPRCGNVWSH